MNGYRKMMMDNGGNLCDDAQSSEPMTADLMETMVRDWMADNGYEDSDDYSEENDNAIHVEWDSAKFDEDLNSWIMYAKDNKGVCYTLTEFNGNIYLNA